MRKPKLNDAKVESSVPAGKVKSLKLSGIHNCCQPYCEQPLDLFPGVRRPATKEGSTWR